jgi:four helix bundle protein
MSTYKELDVWQLSVDLAVEVYKVVSNFPKYETYGLVDQIKRCSVSIASNIAEGSGRATNKDFAHFLSIANGSACELETQLIISHRVGFLDKNKMEELNLMILRISKMLTKLRQSLQK